MTNRFPSLLFTFGPHPKASIEPMPPAPPEYFLQALPLIDRKSFLRSGKVNPFLLIDCGDAVNNWNARWIRCPSCGQVPERDGAIVHWPHKDRAH